jgi:hypothetical protein
LFLGKLLGSVLIASSELLALAPFIAVPFMAGGLSRDLFLATVACFPVLFLITVAVCTLGSVCCEDDGASWACAIVLAAVLCLGVPLPYYLGCLATGTAPFSPKWLCLSPAFGPYLVAVHFVGYRLAYFWMNAAITMTVSFVILGLAAMILNRNWRQRVVVNNFASGWRGKLQSFVHGTPEWRAALREKLLPLNSFQWLAQQDRRPVLSACAFIGSIVLIWLLGWMAWPRAWPSPMNLYITAFILVIGVDWIVTYTAARQIGMDRRDGTLELLLTTPLHPAEIVDGQLAALRSQFRPVRWGLLGLCGLMMAGGFFTRTWTTSAEVSYVVIWGFFFGYIIFERKGWAAMAMWIALNTGRPVLSVFRFPRHKTAWLRHWYWFYWMSRFPSLFRGLSHATTFPSGSSVEVVIVCLAGVICFILAAAAQQSPPEMRNRLLKEMRLIAREPVPDPNDPRFKKWDVNGRVPMSAYVKSYPERMTQSR